MSISRRLALATFIAAVPLAANAGTLTTLHTFSEGNGGGVPAVIYQGGELYGTIPANPGDVYKVNAKTGAYKVLYTFQGGTDGAAPENGVIYYDGLLYGTTTIGGGGENCTENGQVVGCGTIFSIDPKTGAETVLHAFAQDNPNIGFGIPSGLMYLEGSFYGTMKQGGTNGNGSVFSFDLGTGSFATLHSFGSGTDGFDPWPQLILEGSLLYGTTNYGGGGNCFRVTCGTVFSIDPSSGAEEVVYAFNEKKDGVWPYSNLVSKDGLLYGNTAIGGTKRHKDGCPYGCGVEFSFNTATGTEAVLEKYADRQAYSPGLTIAGGKAYEVVPTGNGGNGAIVEVGLKSGHQTVVYSFTGGSDGSNPQAPLTYHDGAFYGTTQGGNGTVFKYVP